MLLQPLRHSFAGCSCRPAARIALAVSIAKSLVRVNTILNELGFKLDMTETDLINFNSFAMHWGERCQDDVIEGATSVVSAPGGIRLVMFGLGAMVFRRRRQAGLAALS